MPDEIVLTIKEYLQLISDLDKEIDKDYKQYRNVRADYEAGEAGQDRVTDAMVHWQEMMEQKRKAVARMVNAKVLRDDERFADSIVDGMLREGERDVDT